MHREQCHIKMRSVLSVGFSFGGGGDKLRMAFKMSDFEKNVPPKSEMSPPPKERGQDNTVIDRARRNTASWVSATGG